MWRHHIKTSSNSQYTVYDHASSVRTPFKETGLNQQIKSGEDMYQYIDSFASKQFSAIYLD